MDMHPLKGNGIMGWILTGFAGALMALLIGYFVPSLIPTQISSQKL